MTDFEVFLAIVSIVWGVLCIILFFKIWKMTNDVESLTSYVKQLTEKVCGKAETPESTAQESIKATDRAFNKGDKVYVIATGKEVEVDRCEGNSYLCDCGLMAGFKWFDASELTRTL